ncbi:MAG TPA: aryl-sulfate sulfotransferase [Ignavibacteria bacterium]|nr:aryl-sulfate sulfotransferase [Ignavibacteria bacterium]HRJ84974.1 aryl-sulfate sulfotransferase [Ignavibacteria bacterium]
MPKSLFAFTCILILNTFLFSSGTAGKNSFSYIDPRPDAKYVNKNTTVVFTPVTELKGSSLTIKGAISITGSVNTNYNFTLVNTTDKQTYIIKPATAFADGEKVTIKFSSAVTDKFGKSIEPFEYSFYVTEKPVKQSHFAGLVNELSPDVLIELEKYSISQKTTQQIPPVTVNYSNNPSPGNILMSNIVFNVQIPNTPHLLILNNDASHVFTRQLSAQVFDFNRQPNGNFTYFYRNGGKYYEIDTNYNLTDSFYTGNGYLTDIHELRVLPNRHALLMSYDKQVVDMSQIVQGGNPAAQVTGLIIQEIDENKNVVFQWRSWDHIPITDATYEDFLSDEIDYIHGNAIELDNDGNIMISSRHLDEITKISRSTGNIIWRLGGKQNQFIFQNDPFRFSHQHGIRRLLNGNILMFDNGNFHIPAESRAVEYILDEVNKIATKMWEYKNTPVIYGNAMGFAQRLENGNTLISWGSTNPTVTEVKPDGSKALEMNLPVGVFSYRVFKYNYGSNVTGVVPVGNHIPGKFNLKQNYPNPFNPQTTIEFDIPENSNVKVVVYNSLGQFIAKLVDTDLNAGSYRTSFNAAEFSSGIYYYRMTANNTIYINKMILIK